MTARNLRPGWARWGNEVPATAIHHHDNAAADADIEEAL
jgi:hypothetical protein